MPDENGSEWHERFQCDIRNLLAAQVIQKDEIDNLLKASRAQTESLELEREQRTGRRRRTR
jgi:hypothetical protein